MDGAAKTWLEGICSEAISAGRTIGSVFATEIVHARTQESGDSADSGAGLDSEKQIGRDGSGRRRSRTRIC